MQLSAEGRNRENMVFLPTLLALLASCDIAYGGIAYGGTFGAGGTPGDYTEDEFAAFFDTDRRNASGIVHFDGYNVSESFPPNSTITGWGAKIEVAPVDHKGDGQPSTGTRITFEAPDDVNLPGNDSDWNSCVAFYPPDWLKKKVRRKEGDSDNSCSFLSDDCQRALQASADGLFWYEGECPFPPPFPEECDNQKSEEADQAFGFTGKSLLNLCPRALTTLTMSILQLRTSLPHLTAPQQSATSLGKIQMKTKTMTLRSAVTGLS